MILDQQVTERSPKKNKITVQSFCNTNTPASRSCRWRAVAASLLQALDREKPPCEREVTNHRNPWPYPEGRHRRRAKLHHRPPPLLIPPDPSPSQIRTGLQELERAEERRGTPSSKGMHADTKNRSSSATTSMPPPAGPPPNPTLCTGRESRFPHPPAAGAAAGGGGNHESAASKVDRRGELKKSPLSTVDAEGNGPRSVFFFFSEMLLNPFSILTLTKLRFFRWQLAFYFKKSNI